MASKKPGTSRLLAFNVDLAMADELHQLAASHGFKSAALFCRAVVRDYLNQPDKLHRLDRLGEMRQFVTDKVAGDVLALLNSYTIEDLQGK